MLQEPVTASRRTMIAGAAFAALVPWASVAQGADGKVYVVAELVARPGKEEDLRAALSQFAPTVPSEPGCLAYQLFEDAVKPGRFLTYETWKDEAAVAAHLSTPKIKAAGPTLAAILAQPVALNTLKRLV